MTRNNALVLRSHAYPKWHSVARDAGLGTSLSSRHYPEFIRT